MKPASEGVKAAVAAATSAGGTDCASEFKNASRIYMNYTGAPLSEYEGSLAEIESLQVMCSVRWTDTIKRMVEDGADTFIEFGPGTTLTGLVKKINRKVTVYNVNSLETLEATVKAITEA